MIELGMSSVSRDNLVKDDRERRKLDAHEGAKVVFTNVERHINSSLAVSITCIRNSLNRA